MQQLFYTPHLSALIPLNCLSNPTSIYPPTQHPVPPFTPKSTCALLAAIVRLETLLPLILWCIVAVSSTRQRVSRHAACNSSLLPRAVNQVGSCSTSKHALPLIYPAVSRKISRNTVRQQLDATPRPFDVFAPPVCATSNMMLSCFHLAQLNAEEQERERRLAEECPYPEPTAVHGVRTCSRSDSGTAVVRRRRFGRARW